MGVKTTVSGLTYANTHVTAAAKAAQDVNSLHRIILEQAAELTRNLQILVAQMTAGNPSDPNIATVNAQITALS